MLAWQWQLTVAAQKPGGAADLLVGDGPDASQILDALRTLVATHAGRPRIYLKDLVNRAAEQVADRELLCCRLYVARSVGLHTRSTGYAHAVLETQTSPPSATATC